MIDCYEMLHEQIDAEQTAAALGLSHKSYGVVTLHRPVNVDARKNLTKVVSMLVALSNLIPLVFPLHPRTRARLETFGLMKRLEEAPALRWLNPMGYIAFMSLVQDSLLVLTDSGGIQEETTYLHIPCLTLRENTERPITIIQGTNKLVNVETVVENVHWILESPGPWGTCPEYWDGQTAKRVARSLKMALFS